jgi:hypothetical protein
MLHGKFQAQDFFKLVSEIKKSNRAAYINVFIDGPLLKFQFVNQEDRLTTVTLFDEGRQTAPTVTETRSL